VGPEKAFTVEKGTDLKAERIEPTINSREWSARTQVQVEGGMGITSQCTCSAPRNTTSAHVGMKEGGLTEEHSLSISTSGDAQGLLLAGGTCLYLKSIVIRGLIGRGEKPLRG